MSPIDRYLRAARMLSTPNSIVIGGVATMIHLPNQSILPADMDIIIPAERLYVLSRNQNCTKYVNRYQYHTERLKIDLHSEFCNLGVSYSDLVKNAIRIKEITVPSLSDLIKMKECAILDGAIKSKRYIAELEILKEFT